MFPTILFLHGSGLQLAQKERFVQNLEGRREAAAETLKITEVRGGKTAGVGGYLVLFPAASQLSFLSASPTDQQQLPLITKCLVVSSEVIAT